MSNDLRVIVRIKNNHLVTFRERHSMSQSEFARLLKISPTFYGRIENLSFYPVKRTGQGGWLPIADLISSIIGKRPEVLFPEAFEYIQKTRFEKEIGIEQLEHFSPQQLTYDEMDAKRHMRERIEHSLGFLKPREVQALKLRCGIDCEEHSLAEVGKVFGVSRERVRQIEAKALRKMRHPKSSAPLKEFTGRDLF